MLFLRLFFGGMLKLVLVIGVPAICVIVYSNFVQAPGNKHPSPYAAPPATKRSFIQASERAALAQAPAHQSIKSHGTHVMDDMQALHDLDAFATWQGGFDYYFAHVEDVETWNSTREALKRKGFAEAATLFEQARSLFESLDSDAQLDADESFYLAKIRKLDERWRDHVPALHQLLAEWRKPRGLEEFGSPGW